MSTFFSFPSADNIITTTTAYSGTLFDGLAPVIGWVLGVTVAVAAVLFLIRQASRGIRGVTRGRRGGRRRRR